MTKLGSILKKPITSALLFVLAAALLLCSGIGGTRAALTYFSDTYVSGVELDSIGVSLVENGSVVSYRNYSSSADGTWNTATGALLENMMGENDNGILMLGKSYDEAISVKNSGGIDQYVRVSLYKYWVDSDGNKVQSMSPDLIDLHLASDSGWILDSKATTSERTVLYYGSILKSGASSAPITDKLTISDELRESVSENVSYETGADGKQYKVITWDYDYDGVTFRIEAEVDAVQTHNAAAAIRSAWGIDPATLGVS